MWSWHVVRLCRCPPLPLSAVCCLLSAVCCLLLVCVHVTETKLLVCYTMLSGAPNRVSKMSYPSHRWCHSCMVIVWVYCMCPGRVCSHFSIVFASYVCRLWCLITWRCVALYFLCMIFSWLPKPRVYSPVCIALVWYWQSISFIAHATACVYSNFDRVRSLYVSPYLCICIPYVFICDLLYLYFIR